MPKCKETSETEEDNTEQEGFNLNECASSPNAELVIDSNCEKTGMEQDSGLLYENISESGLKVEHETESLADDAMERIPNGRVMENITEMKKNKGVKFNPIDTEVNITQRVLRSVSLTKDPTNSDILREAVEEKGKGVSMCDNMGEISGKISVDEVKEEVKHEHVKYPVYKFEYMDERLGDENGIFGLHGKEVQVKRTRGRPRKLQISSQSYDNEDKFIGVSYVNEDKSEIKLEYEQSAAAKTILGADSKSQVEVEIKDDRSYDENGNAEPHDKDPKVKRKRGRPRKLQISSLSYDNEDKLIGVSDVNEDKSEVKLEYEQYAAAKKILGADSKSQVEVEIKDDRSYDENGNAEPHDKDQKVKRKRGRPRKLQISSQSGESGSNTNCKFAITSDLSIQSCIDGLGLKPQRGEPPKTEETATGLYIRKENVKYRHESTLILLDQSMSTVDESRRPKRNFGESAKGPDSDGGNFKGKMKRKRGRPPTANMKSKSGETEESDCKARKSLKLCESPLESRHSNPVIGGERRIGEQQNEAGSKSKSESKKLLSDRILQLLLAAGWTVQYRPRNGRAYNDAVYVNPDGKTHWSVTKAYKVYKEHLESSMNDLNSSTGSGFHLLLEEDLQLLERNIQKKRSDKGKQRPNWIDRDTNENMISTKGIGKHTPHGKKSQKEKNRMHKKRKGSHGSHNLGRISVRKIKGEVKQNRKRCALSARNSLEDADSKENGYILFEGKRTMLGWMIDSAIVPLNGKVQCWNCERTRVCLEGIITKEGIRCNCCDEVFSVFDFEVHSGGKHSQPFKSLYLEGGDSLLHCFLDWWNKQRESLLKGFHFVDFGGGDQSDDTCGICGDGGDLICCDGCPSTFHQSCLGIKKFPSGAWFCCYCSCKFCEKVEAAIHDMTTLSPLLRCPLCEEKYHLACIKQDGMVPGERSDSFCGKYCQELFAGLQLLIGVKHPLSEGFSWTFVRRFELPREVSDCDISEKVAYNAKLAVAFSVMDECFSPLVDHRSGVNLLENIVYNFGSNFHRLNYSSFITAVLERGDEIIAVASIRIHGNQLAEMPFIGTRYMYRRQGMCRRLMSGIESALGSLKVEKLVIPAVPELMDTWTLGFGFKPVHESEKKRIKNLNLLVFPGVDMLEKSLVKEKITEPNVSSSNGNLLLVPEMSLRVDVEENKPDESKDSEQERNCATDNVESPTMNVEEGDNDAESAVKLLNESVEEKEETGKLTEKHVDSIPDIVDNQRESNSEMADDSHLDQTDTKRPESCDLEDKTPLSNDEDGFAGKDKGTEELSDQQTGCYIIEHSQLLGNGGTEKEMDNKTLTTLRVLPRLIQRSLRT